ncbi:hypothetical protein PPTG_23930 [Phytophthora nicotianae INRA-310]|uniref:Uncharacterized protein n=1 Tax=Phytophthora nicotianae (strain INRA-310) TaxID=761204 RepID=W2PNE8_PHYN3|nr:hypothetical protein PPTG_23930 [Phytophthora nicotianae INRA-310]ETN02518.1 hypothetical protein PPTG_23930 [Phytophthora nicotianae INRA-310]
MTTGGSTEEERRTESPSRGAKARKSDESFLPKQNFSYENNCHGENSLVRCRRTYHDRHIHDS